MPDSHSSARWYRKKINFISLSLKICRILDPLSRRLIMKMFLIYIFIRCVSNIRRNPSSRRSTQKYTTWYCAHKMHFHFILDACTRCTEGNSILSAARLHIYTMQPSWCSNVSFYSTFQQNCQSAEFVRANKSLSLLCELRVHRIVSASANRCLMKLTNVTRTRRREERRRQRLRKGLKI